ncbi:MAG: hypothetical protein KBS81_03395, partial [Spirochaetales bacterium]|nr:hypothetical protein [Candidatus Physcosoma equi]
AKKIQKIASSLKSNAEIDAKNDAKNDISVSFKQLKRIKHYGRRASTILQVYLLEEDENLDIRAAETRLRQINTECGDVARAYRVDSSVVSLETEIEDVIRLASESASILKSVIKTREENKLLEI